MSNGFFNIKNGANIGNLAADPSDGRDGDTYYNTTSNTVREYVNGGWTDVVQTTTTQTLTNKTINGPSNTITNVATSSIAPQPSDTLIGNNTGGSASPTSLTVTQVNTMLGTLANPMTTLGDTLYEDASPTAARLPGNTTSNREFLTSQGSGGLATAPAWTVLQTTDIPGVDGGTGGEILYQSAANTTSFIPNGTAGKVLTSNGGTAVPTWDTPTAVQVFASFLHTTSTQTYPTPAGAIAIRVRILGAGGGGGGFANTGSTGGRGGGAGAYIEHIIYSPATSYTYTIGQGGTAGGATNTGTVGNGGTSTFSGGSLSAGGGEGGGNGPNSGTAFAVPGNGGTPSGGNISSSSGGGGYYGGFGVNTNNFFGGNGGNSFYGGGGRGGAPNVGATATAGTAPGSGGGGNGGTGSSAGTTGADGGIIIEAYYQ